jgi:tripartite-type tricarboxylate transporter receptor subunit TctC
MRSRTLVAVLAALAISFAHAARAETVRWPSRPVTVVVPYAAGGMADVMARLVAHQLSQ